MDRAIRVQTLDEAVCILHSANTLWEDMIQLLSLQLLGQTGLLVLVSQLV